MKGIPEGFHTATPYLIVRDADSAIAFYKKAFAATELLRLTNPNGKIMHGEIRIGDSPVMLVNENQEYPDMQSPQTRGGSPIHLHVYVEDADTFANRAVAAGER